MNERSFTVNGLSLQALRLTVFRTDGLLLKCRGVLLSHSGFPPTLCAGFRFRVGI
jgi:hypothetical protein